MAEFKTRACQNMYRRAPRPRRGTLVGSHGSTFIATRNKIATYNWSTGLDFGRAPEAVAVVGCRGRPPDAARHGTAARLRSRVVEPSHDRQACSVPGGDDARPQIPGVEQICPSPFCGPAAGLPPGSL
jgi:hypothetical protein